MTEEEKKSKADEFTAEMKTLCGKFGITNVAFTGELEKKYLGTVMADNDDFSYGDFFESCLNIARLYQAAREKVKMIFDKFEK